jgi:hypothetical protein
MNIVEDDATGGLDKEDEDDDEPVDSEEPTVDVLPTTPNCSRKKKKTIADLLSEDVLVAASAITAPAGAANLHQCKLSGKDRKYQLRYDICLDVTPSTEANTTMIYAAQQFFNKAKKMDDTLVIYPWFKTSTSSKIQESRFIPETMGAFKTYFHQANPHVDGGFVYMRIWLGHDKYPGVLQDDLEWWMKNKNYGLYPRSVQAENILLSVGRFTPLVSLTAKPCNLL